MGHTDWIHFLVAMLAAWFFQLGGSSLQGPWGQLCGTASTGALIIAAAIAWFGRA